MQDERQQDIFEIATRALAEAKALEGGRNAGVTKSMIYQLEWILETQREGKLEIPTDPSMIGTLRHVMAEYSGGPISYKDSVRLLKILWGGGYLMKPKYYPFIIKTIDDLILLINQNYSDFCNEIKNEWKRSEHKHEKEELASLFHTNSDGTPRLDIAEHPLIKDLEKMKNDLRNKSIELPILRERRKFYPFFGVAYCYSLFEKSFPQIYKRIIQINDMVVEGMRPGPDGIVHGLNTKCWP
jgi:hypothetical protein